MSPMDTLTHVPRTPFHMFLALVALGGLAGCGAQDPGHEEGGELGVAEQEIASEKLGGDAEIVARRYLDPDVARVSYAAPQFAGTAGTCSATMIGPNVMMTAAHCGATNGSAVFRTYDNLSTSSSVTESFACKFLLQTFSDTDLMLLYCAPNAGGENPGDKYGYLDFDTSVPTVGQDVYSVWWNPISSKGIADARLYSEGEVTALGQAGWFSPGSLNIGVTTDLWCDSGASGSSQVNAANDRILIGPTSTGPEDAPDRHALSIRDYLYWGEVSSSANVSATNLAALGLTAADYLGYVDDDLDWLFDVQVDLERARGENRRSWYWLGFDSERRNAGWNDTSFSTFYPQSAMVRLHSTSTSTYAPGLVHPRLNLKANVDYQVKLSIYTVSKSAGATVFASFRKNGTFYDWTDLAPAPGAGWQTRVFDLKSTVADPGFELTLSGAVDAYVANISIVERGAVMDFDSADERANWYDPNKGTRAITPPDGNGTGVDWAGLVIRNTSVARGSDWPMTFGQTTMIPGKQYKLCFAHQQFGTLGTSQSWGLMRVTSTSSELVRMNFKPTVGSFGQSCTPVFTASADMFVQFGVDADPIPIGFELTATPRYLIDDLSFVEQ